MDKQDTKFQKSKEVKKMPGPLCLVCKKCAGCPTWAGQASVAWVAALAKW